MDKEILAYRLTSPNALGFCSIKTQFELQGPLIRGQKSFINITTFQRNYNRGGTENQILRIGGITMTKYEADIMLQQKMEKLNGRTENASNEECVQLIDSMLKVYTILANSDGFDSEFSEAPSPNIGS